MKRFILLALALGGFAGATPGMAANCLSNASGNWNATGTWTGCVGGNGTPANTPGTNDTATIRNGNTVTLTAAAAAQSVTITSAAGNNTLSLLNVGAQTLTIGGGTGGLTITGGAGNRRSEIRLSTGNVNAGAVGVSGNSALITFTGAGTMNIKGNLQSGATFSASTGTVNFNGTAAQNIGAYTYNTLKVNNAAGASLTAAGSVATLTIGDATANSVFSDGGFQLTSTGTLNLTSGTLKLGGPASSTTFPGFAVANIGVGTTVEYAAGVNGQVVSIAPAYQNLTLTGAGKQSTAGTLSIAGNLTGTADLALVTTSVTLAGSWLNTGTFGAGSGGVTLTGVGKQITGSAAGIVFGTLTVNGTYTNNNADTTIGMTVSTALSGTGTLTQGANTVLTLAGTSGISTLNATANTPNTVVYSGGAGQTVKATTYHHLTDANASTLTLAGNTTVNGTFTFSGTSGDLDTGANKLTIAAAATVSGAGTARHVVGNLEKTFSAAGAFTYDVGDGTNYTPVTVNFSAFTGGLGNLTASVTNTDHPDTTAVSSGIDPTLSINRYWTLKNATLAGTYTATLNYIDGVPVDRDGAATATSFVIRRGSSCTGTGGARTCSSWSQPPLSGVPTNTQAAASGISVASGDPEADFALGEVINISFSREPEFVYSRELY